MFSFSLVEVALEAASVGVSALGQSTEASHQLVQATSTSMQPKPDADAQTERSATSAGRRRIGRDKAIN